MWSERAKDVECKMIVFKKQTKKPPIIIMI